jgi:predicted nucleic acid-binding protein
MKCVIDASVIAGLLLPDENNARVSLLRRVLNDQGVAPALLQLEIVNFMLIAERRKRIDSLQLAQLIEAADLLQVTLQPILTSQQRLDLMHLARKHRLSAYDAAYLELSLRLGLPLASLDHSLLKAAAAEGVKSAL